MRQLIFVFGGLLLSLHIEGQEANPWNLSKDKDGIQVYTRSDTGSNIREAKATLLLDSVSIDRVMAYFLNFDRHKEWLYTVEQSTVLKRVDDQRFIINYKSKAPWPVKDRDVVLDYRLKRTSNGFEIKTEAKPDFIPEDDKVVRIPEAWSTWRFTQLKSGQVEVYYFNHSDAGGNIPTWMVNLAAAKIPYQSLFFLREAMKSEVNP